MIKQWLSLCSDAAEGVGDATGRGPDGLSAQPAPPQPERANQKVLMCEVFCSLGVGGAGSDVSQ